jgi:HEPN domain-containing protein
MKRLENVLGLIRNAGRDFRLAERYEKRREYVTASILYRRAVEKTLRALFIRHEHKGPPANASFGYLVGRTKLPNEILLDLDPVQVSYGTIENEVMDEEERIAGIEEVEMMHSVESTKHGDAVLMRETVRRLLSYANANI